MPGRLACGAELKSQLASSILFVLPADRRREQSPWDSGSGDFNQDTQYAT